MKRYEQLKVRKPKKRKDTKRWCRGKVGREHKIKIVGWPQTGGRFGITVEQCEVCGRQFRIHFPVFHGKVL